MTRPGRGTRFGLIIARAIMIFGSVGVTVTAAIIGVKVAPAGSVQQYVCSMAIWAGIGCTCYYVNMMSDAIMNGGRK